MGGIFSFLYDWEIDEYVRRNVFLARLWLAIERALLGKICIQQGKHFLFIICHKVLSLSVSKKTSFDS